MTPEDKLKLYQELTQTNMALCTSLSKARRATSQYDHHLLQHDSTPPAERLRYLLAQAHMVASQADFSESESDQLLGQLEQLQQLCQPHVEQELRYASIRKVYE